MSSTFSFLCLTHDPAIEIDGPEMTSLDAALAYLQGPALPDQLQGHAACDLLIGRYSYPLIEVTCPPSRREGAPRHYPFHPNQHHTMEADWLRLLWATWRGGQRGDEAEDRGIVSAALDQFKNSCWTPDRVNRLRFALDIDARLRGRS